MLMMMKNIGVGVGRGVRIVSTTSFSNSKLIILSSSHFSITTTTTSRRVSMDSSVYDKNLEETPPVPENAVPVVPEEIIQPESEEYWIPHPQTGVFVPPTDIINSEGESPVAPENGVEKEGSVLEEEAWFRPTNAEEPEKPTTLEPPPEADSINYKP